MLRDEVASLIAQRCGKRTDLISAITAEMQYVQVFVLEQHSWVPWFLETEHSETTTTATEERIQLPEDFLDEIEDQHLWVWAEEEDDWSPLEKEEYDVGAVKYPGSGRPKAYSIVGDYFTLHPNPDAVYRLRMRYYKHAESLANNIENEWLKYAAAVMIAECGQIIAGRYVMNAELEGRFKQDAVNAWDSLYRQHIRRENVNKQMSMGDD
jgi:hypothetical protein